MQSRWKELKPTGDIPTGRIGHTAVCNAEKGCLYVWGGVNETADRGSRYMDDLFRFDIGTSTWHTVATNGEKPCARAFHTAVLYRGLMYIFGGCNGKGRFNRIFRMDPETGSCAILNTSGDPPTTRYCHTAVQYQASMIVFGGKCGGRNSNKRLADMFSYDFGTGGWTNIVQSGEIPESRSAHTSVVSGSKMLMFGGRNANGDCCEDLYEFNLVTDTWRRVEIRSPLFGRARHSAVVHNERLVVFGGWNGKKKMNDLFILRLDTMAFEYVQDTDEADESLPCRRECHTAVVCENSMYLCCGRFRGLFLNDVFELPLHMKSLKELVRDWILLAEVRYDEDQHRLPQCVVSYLDEYTTSGLFSRSQQVNVSDVDALDDDDR
jgi:N-acetylneuraminic acid mutarotase